MSLILRAFSRTERLMTLDLIVMLYALLRCISFILVDSFPVLKWTLLAKKMVDVLPLTLVGRNLGERHRYLNDLIDSAYQQNVPLLSILELPEKGPIDRVFKIELASKYTHVDFIVKNLKEKDMLYVSKALRCLWLLEPQYSHIVNPVYLENHLYPEMITTAVNKMKNVIELRLKDPQRCQEFYEYYNNSFEVAIKFLWHCSKEFISHEFSKVIDKIKPKHLKILCEKCPQVAKLYFEGLQSNEAAHSSYSRNYRKYWKSIFTIVKLDGNLFINLLEKYFTKSGSFGRLSSLVTKYIMKNYKNRYLVKPELYAACLLDVKTLARYLSHEEIKDIVMRLARAKYLKGSYTYKDAEPFLKRLNPEQRSLVKKQLFVDKNIGTMIENWPYPPPEEVQVFKSNKNLLNDIEHDPYEYMGLSKDQCYDVLLKGIHQVSCCKASNICKIDYRKHKSSFDQLFERYRFLNFNRTFLELRKSLLTESTVEGRRNMLLVLVSKTGGKEAKLEQLLKFLEERHSNEPVNLRDAIARSMVKRAFVWRLGNGTWDLLLKWANTSISEILHTKVLRHLLAGSTCPSADVEAYLLDYSDFTTYALNAAEKACVVERLPALLISANAPEKLLNTLKAYKLYVSSVPEAEEFLVSAARSDDDILLHLFKSKVARQQLIRESFKITQDEAGYMNALKHDVSLLANGESFVAAISKEKPNHDRFLRALVLYFSESDGLGAHHYVAIKKAIKGSYHESFARPSAFLFNMSNEIFQDYIENVDVKSLESDQRKFAIVLRANASVARPVVDLNTVNWYTIGAKFICNKLLICSEKDVDANIRKCLNWKKTMRVALHLAIRNGSITEALTTVIEARPMVALKIVLSDIRKGNVDPALWNLVKSIILNIDLSKNTMRYIKRSLSNLRVKSNIEADYWATVYWPFRRVSELTAMPMLCKIENLLTEVDENTLKQIISEFLSEKLDKYKVIPRESFALALYFRIIAKYLLTSQSEQDQKVRIETVCDPFFDKIEVLWHEIEDKSEFTGCLDDFLLSLKYSQTFLNTKYVSCIPMFERILERLVKILPREENFKKYVCVHLTMLYCRSIRQALKQKPTFFEDLRSIQDDGVELIGFILGKYIGLEIYNLVENCFQSIIDIYQPGVRKFFRSYFDYGSTRTRLMTSVLRGLIDSGVEGQLLAQHVFENEWCKGRNPEMKEILELLKGTKYTEAKFFLYQNIYL